MIFIRKKISLKKSSREMAIEAKRFEIFMLFGFKEC